MSKYELVYLVSPDATQERQAEIAERMKGHVATMGGTLESLELWEKRRLAYPVKKYKEAFYYIIRFEGDGKLVDELEKRLRVADNVIRFLTVRMDDDLKLEAKRKAYYERKRASLDKKKARSEASEKSEAPVRERRPRQEDAEVRTDEQR